jgi:hypothetical protein
MKLKGVIMVSAQWFQTVNPYWDRILFIKIFSYLMVWDPKDT